MPSTPPVPSAPDTPTHLTDAVLEIERHVARAGWDGPVRVFALVSTASVLAAEPDLATQLPAEAVAAARVDARHLTSVEQEGLPAADSLENLLAGLSWPDAVDGAAVVVERVVLPSSAEQAMPADPDQALEYLMTHPDRQDVRLAVGVLRGGESWCAIRARTNDDDAAVAGGQALVPGLVAAMVATLV